MTGVQTCDHELGFAASREVRHTVIRIIGDRLREDRENTRWRGKDYDFTGVVFDGGDLSGAVFSKGRVNFNYARFTGGKVYFSKTHFTNCTVSFAHAQFTRGKVNFNDAEFTEAMVRFDRAQFTGGDVNFDKAKFTKTQARFDKADFTNSMVATSSNESTGAQVFFNRVEFTGGRVDFSKAEGICPYGLWEAQEQAEPGVVLLPEAWQRTTEEDDPNTSAEKPPAPSD